MMDAATLRYLEDNSRPAPDAQPPPQAQPAPPVAAPSSGNGALTGQALTDYLNAHAVNVPFGATEAPKREVPSDAVAGPNGLMWNKSGGYDPATGELVISGKPFGSSSPLAAASTAVVSGVPIAGGPMLSAVQKGAADIAAARPGAPADAATQALADVKDVTASSQAAHPGLTTAGNITGAVAGTAPLAAAAPAAFGMVGPLPMRVGAGGLTATALGGVDAGVRGEDIGSGALGGAAMGGGAPIVGSALGTVARAIMNRMPSAIPDALSGMSSKGRNLALSAFQAQTPESITAAKTSMGPSGFTGELTPQSTRFRLGSIADNNGPGKAIVRGAYGARSANPVLIDPNAEATGTRARINQYLTDAFGPETNVVASTAADKAARKAAADPLYEAWRQTPVPPTPELDAILQLPSVKKAIPAAANLAGDDGEPAFHQFFTKDANGDMTLDTTKTPTAQVWDYIKQAMDDKYKEAAPGTNQARQASMIANRITTAIDNHPDPAVANTWQQARQAWASPSQLMNARDYGGEILQSGKSADQVASDVSGYSPPQISAAVEGARNYAQQMLDRTTRGDTTARNLMLAPNTQEKLRYMLGDQKAGDLLTSLDQEANIAAKNQEVVGGSPTGGKVQRSRLTQPPETGGFSGFLNNLNAMRPGTYLSTGENAYRNARYQNMRSEAAPFLTRPVGPNDALVQQLLSGAQQQGANAQRGLAVRNLATGLINAGGGEEARRRLSPYNLGTALLMRPGASP